MNLTKQIRNIFSTLTANLFLSALLIALLFNWSFDVANSKQEVLGCDPLGYSRQAQLFRNGSNIISPLKTDLKGETYSILKRWAGTTSLPEQSWYQMVAPHCHHYRSSSKAIIDQYPFGTGLLLSFFPVDHARQWLVLICLSAISLLGVFSLYSCSNNIIKLYQTIGAIMPMAIIHSFWTRSDSLAPSIVVAYIAAHLSLVISHASHKYIEKLIYQTLLLGLLLGFSICLRPGNLFLSITSIIVAIAVFNTSHQTLRQKQICISIGGAAYLPGCLSLAWFNKINTGSWLQTTYTEIDTGFTNKISHVIANVKKIPTEKGEIIIFMVYFLIVITLMLIVVNKFHRKSTTPITLNCTILIIAWLGFIAFVILCLFKKVFISYYVAPQLALTSALICGSCQELEKPIQNHSYYNISIVWLTITCITLTTFFSTKVSTKSPNPLEPYHSQASIVWADNIGSYLLWHYNIPTAKIQFGSDKAKLSAINYLSQHDVLQFFSDEGNIIEQMSGLLGRGKLRHAGHIKGTDLYIYNPSE